jgi:hypothetical protein
MNIQKSADALISKGTYVIETLRNEPNNKVLLLRLTLENGYKINASMNVVYTEENTIVELKKKIRIKLEELEQYKQHVS